jgi:hypothetical protein
MDSRYADADLCLVSGSWPRIHVADRSGSITAALSGSEYQAGYRVGVVPNG